ncbi:MAG: DUF5362 family protein [Saprospiraceae bacterium]|nr:DUF5362 family protein [Saprospiraceae bacterium]
MESYEQPTPSLQIDSTSSMYLRETSKWAKFLSIVGFIMCGLLVILAFFIGRIMASLSPLGDLEGSGTYSSSSVFGGRMLTILYLIIAVVYLMPCLYLYRFAEKMQLALASTDQTFLTSSFSNLKSLFKFTGILMIIMLCLYGLGILIALFSFAAIF